MNAQTPLDDITAFMGKLPADEYEQRRRLRTCRNAATQKVAQTTSGDVRALCSIINERVAEWIYTPAEAEVLAEVVKLCRRLLMVADDIETLEARYYG